MSELIRPTALTPPILCLVTELGVVDGNVEHLIDIIDRVVDNGVDMVQVRAPELDDAMFDDLVAMVADTISDRALTIVNPSSRGFRPYAQTHGVQLTENAAISARETRQLYGATALIGRSVHSVAGACDAAMSGVDYVVLGTIFPSGSHPGGEHHGLSIVEDVASKIDIPIICIGGITARNAASVISAGAQGVAVVRSILGTGDSLAATRALRSALDDAVIG